MKTIRFRSGYNRRNDYFYYTDAEIIDTLPEIGDIYDLYNDEIVTEVVEEKNYYDGWDDSYKYDFYEIVTKKEEEGECEEFHYHVAITKKYTLAMFVEDLYYNAELREYMDMEMATREYRNFYSDQFELDNEVSPESLMEAWNEFYKSTNGDDN